MVEAIINQQSTAPYVSRILIQRLVKSNPSPAYVKRITQVFRDNGRGVLQMAVVVKAILLDPEARAAREYKSAIRRWNPARPNTFFNCLFKMRSTCRMIL